MENVFENAILFFVYFDLFDIFCDLVPDKWLEDGWMVYFDIFFCIRFVEETGRVCKSSSSLHTQSVIAD